MANKTEICNLALSHIGASRRLGNIETDKGKEADACRLWYAQCRKGTLQDTDWPFAQKYQTLGLLSENPNSDWAYQYAQPSDCLCARRILSGLGRNETNDQRIPFAIAGDNNSRVIFTDKEDAELRYTVDIDNEVMFSPAFVDALAWRLAMNLASELIRRPDIIQLTMQQYQFAKTLAESDELNEGHVDPEPPAEMISVRL